MHVVPLWFTHLTDADCLLAPPSLDLCGQLAPSRRSYGNMALRLGVVALMACIAVAAAVDLQSTAKEAQEVLILLR